MKCLQLGICVVMSTRAALQKKVENMFLMMWMGNMVNYLALLKKGKQHISCLIALLSICGPKQSDIWNGTLCEWHKTIINYIVIDESSISCWGQSNQVQDPSLCRFPEAWVMDWYSWDFWDTNNRPLKFCGLYFFSSGGTLSWKKWFLELIGQLYL